MSERLRRIVIAGGGTAGWMAAAAIARTLGKVVDVTLVESDAIGTIGVGESTIPPLVTYNRLLGINEAEFMRATNATFKLGIMFDDWKEVGHNYFHSFGLTGKDHWSAGFQHFWLHGLTKGHDQSYDDYCLELVAAREGKFAHLPDDRMNYAYQLDSTLYARFLRKMAEADGTKRVEGKIANVEVDNESGNIATLVLESGTRIEGDLFLDCTGFRALLIGQTLGVGHEDWTHWLPCDSAIALQTESVGPAVPFTRAMAHDSGWQWRIPLQHRVGNGHVYCSDFIADDEAERQLLENLEGPALAQPKQLFFTTGRRRSFWNKNVVAIGLSAGFLEPLESTSIHLIQDGITELLTLFPDKSFRRTDIDEYNRRMSLHFERVRDFLLLHYVATQRDDSEMWRHFRSMELPDSLQEKITAWVTRGYIVKYEFGLFLPPSWIAVMLGQNLQPRGYDRRVDAVNEDTLVANAAAIRRDVAAAVRSTPEHAAFIQQIGAASGTAALAAGSV